MHAFGVHFCVVHIASGLGTERITRWMGTRAGRVLNPKTNRSQLIGGAEEVLARPQFGRYTNAPLADHQVPANADISERHIEFIDEHDPYINTMSVKGIGDITIVGVATVSNTRLDATAAIGATCL